MIVKMKKASIIVQAKDASPAIKGLRSLGLMHVQNQKAPSGKDINALQEEINLTSQALEVISEAEFATGCEGTLARSGITDWKTTCRHIIDIWKRLDQLEEFSSGLNEKIKEWEIWGDFQPQDFQHLADQGVYIKLYQLPKKDLGLFPEGVALEQLAEKKNMVYCAAISREQFSCPLKEIELPKMSLGHMRSRIDEDRRIIEAIRDDLRSLFCYQPQLRSIKSSLEKELEFQQALCGMADEGSLNYLTGYIPFDAQEALAGLAKKEQWGLLISEPSEDDTVPTLIRNPKWVSLINPVFKLLEIIPGYRELDISILFLIFFSLFFGIIIGDAGYGLIYFTLTLFIERKFGRKIKDKTVFFLFYALSFCAIIWGFLTATFFGQEWLAGIGIKPLVPLLNDMKFIQAFCLFLGAFHLSLAHVWRAVIKSPALAALADIGWISILWAGFFLAKTLILGDGFPNFTKWLIIAGVFAVILFTNPQRNILKMLGVGLATLALSLVNSFTDVVSYIRLFAVGLAGVAIADTVNVLSKDAGGNIIIMALIVILGHSMNIILGPMSVLVHGIRLNVLEFSGHAGITWSGVEFKPLRE